MTSSAEPCFSDCKPRGTMNRLLCYAHYDEKGNVKDFVKHALESMAEVCSVMLFVSNSPLPEHEKEYLGKICRHVIINDNSGYDFSMWKTALETCVYSEFDEIVLMNSSIYGPFRPVEAIFSEMSSRNSDFWGITECFQMRPHVQSYFLVFRKKVITSPEFAMFWRGVLPYKNKNQIVMSYEVGLSQWLLDSGFEMDVYCSLLRLADYVQRSGKKIRLADNPSLKHAVDLLHLGVPFLKRELVKKNAVDMRSIASYLHSNSYPVDYLIEHDNEEKQVCPICGAAGQVHYKRLADRLNVRNVERYDYYKCLSGKCGLLWMYPVPSYDTMKFIDDNYGSYAEGASVKGMGAAKRSLPVSIVMAIMNTMIKLLGIHKKRASLYLLGLDKVPPGKLLEIRCGSGDRLVKLRELGWDVVGHEIDGNVLDILHAKSIRTVDGEIETNDLDSDQFDVILLNHVVERTRNVKCLLSECHRLLKPGGKIYLSTLNMNSLTRKIFGKYWFGLDVPRNLLVFDSQALRSILTEALYEDIKLQTVAINAELYAMHSLDISLNKWTCLMAAARTGKEMVPALFQLIAYFINKVTGSYGDECFAIASKKEYTR